MSTSELSNQGNPTNRLNDDEIDLKELFIALWKGKWVIIATTIICAAVAVAYALTAKQVWTTKAVITYPQVKDFADYQQMVSGFQPVFDVYQESGSILVSNKLDNLYAPQTLFNIYVQQFELQANKIAYMASNAEFQRELSLLQTGTEGGAEEEIRDRKSSLYSAWYSKLTAVVEKTSGRYTLKAQLSNANDSYAFLTGYVDFVAEKARSIAIDNFSSIVSCKRSEIVQQKALFTDQAKGSLFNERVQAQYALEIATAAGIDKPQQNLNNEDLFVINIGANALAAKVKVLDNLTELSIIEPKLHQLNAKFDLLKNLTISPDVEFKTFQFIESPEKPISRTSPKRSHIAILGVLLGGMLGTVIVLIRYAFAKKD
ncbi:Wzz/FepE/Etk N-terminal domain-containing protein [Marinomonas sp.]|uniref:Wzz/FepE/Etk N-terminal domain-containing protein n=1 Tax=Marinomonas sp. TaxID=1904862 RepID=UPI003BAD26F1